MKNILFAFLSCILIAGCESVLDGPPVIKAVELNSDSLHTRTTGTYKVYLKSVRGDDPVFYTCFPYKSGETLVPMSSLQSMMEKKTNSYLDTIAMKNGRIQKLENEKEIMEQQLNQKNLLIRFLTGK